jgi:hypothetical protein
MNLGLRVSSDDPKKTRIAAVFSLWMCTFRPVSVRWEISKDDPRAPKLCAALNFWIAQATSPNSARSGSDRNFESTSTAFCTILPSAR